ncbi:monocarboxylate transporter 10-like [Aplysia californica]|uniref:Monocarboxylate transporter 10-like n=1 Tax=Aplysia californica TaxID=6500 RepID=A0ABM0JR29_APLCA|nr:monocarboxylate transporter 10-like [Aplysia californica]
MTSETAARAEDGGVLLSESRQGKGQCSQENDTTDDTQQSSPSGKTSSVSAEQDGFSEKLTSSPINYSQPDKKRQRQKLGCLKSFLTTCFPVENKQGRGTAGKKLFHFYLLKNSSFLCFCLSICLFTAALRAAFTFIPALVKSKGLSATDATLILSIAGVFDTLSRIATGLILDSRYLRPWRPMIYNSLIFAIALISFALPFFSSFVAFVAICGFYGIVTGAFISQKAVIIVDILGKEHMSSSFGILLLFQGIGTCVGPPLSGAFRDMFGSFDEAFYLGGGLMVVAGCLMVVGNCFLHFARRRGKQSGDRIAAKGCLMLSADPERSLGRTPVCPGPRNAWGNLRGAQTDVDAIG